MMRVLGLALCLVLAGCSGTANTQVDARVDATTHVDQATVINQQTTIIQQQQTNTTIIAPVAPIAPTVPAPVATLPPPTLLGDQLQPPRADLTESFQAEKYSFRHSQQWKESATSNGVLLTSDDADSPATLAFAYTAYGDYADPFGYITGQTVQEAGRFLMNAKTIKLNGQETYGVEWLTVADSKSIYNFKLFYKRKGYAISIHLKCDNDKRLPGFAGDFGGVINSLAWKDDPSPSPSPAAQ